MTKIIEPRGRWADANASADDRRIGELFRSVVDPQPLPPPTLARIHARLRGRRALSPYELRDGT